VNTTSILKDKAGQPLDIIPGMVAEVEILSEKKSVLDYILRPVLRIQERAFRD
jgi:membrane fusion protein, adhesin transport system